MGIWKRSSFAAVLALVFGAAGPPALDSAAALTAVPPLLGPGRVVTATATAQMTAPADGRLRTKQFQADVTGVAWPARTRADGHEVAATTGHRLVVFTVSLSEPGSVVTPVTPDLPKLVVWVGKVSLPVPLTGIQGQLVAHFETHLATGTATYAASVPDGTHQVSLALSEGSFTQRFDLWTLRRLPPAPVVLYRAPSSAFVTASVTPTATLTITCPTGTSAPIALSFTHAALSEWTPAAGSTTTPPSTAQAFLWVRLLATDSADWTYARSDEHFTLRPLPADRLVFTPEGGAPVAASSATFSHGLTWPLGDTGLFDADYWFVVPASLTEGTLTVTAGPANGQNLLPTGTSSAQVTDSITGATLPLTFPDPPASTAQHRPGWTHAPVPESGLGALAATATAPHRGADPSPGPGPGGFPVWAALVALFGIAGAVLAAGRARHWRRPTSAGASGPADGAPPGAMVPDATRDGPGPRPRVGGTAGAVTAPVPPPSSVEVPPLGGDGALVVRVLGHVEIAPCELPSDRRLLAEDLCSFLALHDERPLTTAELLEAIWPLDGERKEATAKTVHNTVGRLRQGVGPEHLPDAAEAGGYRLVGAVTDWGEVKRLLAAASGAPDEESRNLRAQALAHVRGAPFEGAHAAQFHWAYASGLVSEILRTVTDAAHAVSGDLLCAGDPAQAEWAARQGLRASRDDERLWLDAARAGEALGASVLARVWRDAAAALGAPRVRELRRSLGSS